MKKIILLFAVSATALLALSCSDLMEKEPANRFSAETFFKNEKDLQLYTNSLIGNALPGITAITQGEDRYTDLCGTRKSKELYWGTYNAGKADNWTASTFSFLRSVAYMLENMPRCKDAVSEDIYNHYEGVARLLRAYITMERIKTFGDFYFIDQVIQPDDTEILYSKRQDREYVFHMLVEDIRFACENCLATGEGIHTDGRIYINRHVALAMASRIFLYEGTYRKYHSTNPSTRKPWSGEYESWQDLLDMAETYSKQLIDSKVFKLNKDYRSLFVSTALPLDEVIWGRSCSEELNVSHSTSYFYCASTQGDSEAPTKEYVRMFLKTDGQPAGAEISVTQEFEGRDARLSATVLAPGRTWKRLDGRNEDLYPNWTWTLSGYQWIKFVVLDEYSMGGTSKSYNSVPVLRYAEVLLNYAEAAAELGHMTQEIWNATIGLLRERAGVKNIYPGSAGYVQDTWLRDYYTRDVLHPAGLTDIQLEVRRERATELTMEGNSRYDDLMRWNLGDLIERRYEHKGWRGIWVTADEYRDGIIWNGRKYTVSSRSQNASNYKISGATKGNWSLSNGTYGYLIYHYDLVWDDMMYTKPIPSKALSVNPALGQNYGWEWI